MPKASMDDNKQLSFFPNETPAQFLSIDASQIFNHLQAANTTKKNVVLLTSNQRLSRFRLHGYEQMQLAAGKAAWLTPNILPWSAWLQQQWLASDLGVWLHPEQENLLWQHVIAEDEQTLVLNSKALSKQAKDAWKILADYFIPLSCLDRPSEEFQALARWGKTVGKATTHTLQHQVLAKLTKASQQPIPDTILLDGFDVLSPAQEAYLLFLQQQGSQILQVVADQTPATLSISAYADEESELRQVCQHIRKLLSESPELRIGVLVLELEQKANLVSRIFSEELAPHLSLSMDLDKQGDYFNLSLGAPLAKQSMVQTAFAILSLSLKQTLNVEDYHQLLLSPYMFGYAQEKNTRAAIDAKLRKDNIEQITTLRFAQVLAQHPVPLLQQQFALILELQHGENFAGKQPISHWVMVADKLLKAWSWYEQNHEEAEITITLTANEAAQVQNWRDMMLQLTNLDDYSGWITWSQAVTRMQEQAFEHIFRPAPGHANIQIMGLLESRNLRFDIAFALGLDDMAWPPAAKPHPLIPVQEQVKFQTPHASSEREWMFASSVWENMQFLAPHLFVSFASNKDKQEVQASPFLWGQPIQKETNTASSRYANTQINHQAPTSTYLDTAIPIQSSEKIRGGTGILTSQSACAFQAFAQFRLGLNNLEKPSLGLNHREQGIMLHAALESFWKMHKNQQNLSKLHHDNLLGDEIKTHIHQAWLSLNGAFSHSIKSLESNRLQSLLQQWFEFELSRNPFDVVENEQWAILNLGLRQSLSLHLKLDRVDMDKAGNRIIIDYKTGQPKASQSMGERPESPQLPAYFIAEENLGKQVDAVTFAKIRNQDIAFEGFAQENDVLPKLKAYQGKKDLPQDWSELGTYWKDVLNELADSFCEGHADIAPKNKQTCNYCDFSGLCRISASSPKDSK